MEDRSESRRLIKRAGSRHRAYVLRSVRRRTQSSMTEHDGQAQPIATQLGGWLACSPPFALEKLLPIKSGGTLQHIIDGPGQLMRQEGQGLARAMCFLEAAQRLLARRMVAETQERGFGEGPLEVRGAHL